MLTFSQLILLFNQQTEKYFSSKLVKDLAEMLNPNNPLGNDWSCILDELRQSHSETSKVAQMSNRTAEALLRWQTAGKSLDDLHKLYTNKRPDVCAVIEDFQQNTNGKAKV